MSGAFHHGENCARVCWLGINPGVTTADQAYRLLNASGQIRQNSLEATETGILVSWFTEESRTLASSVYLYSVQGVVQSISFDELAPWTIGDFVDLLDPPDGINISMETYGDVMAMPYAVYFSSARVLASADAGDPGPHPDDRLAALKLNLEYDRKFFQPWIGYGHLDVYLADQPVHAHPSEQP